MAPITSAQHPSHFGFLILDFGLKRSTSLFKTQSKIQNLKSKISSLTGGFLLALIFTSPAFAQSVDHSDWNGLLQRHVNERGLVNYVGVKQEQAVLDAYLARVATAEVASLPKPAQLAFWINAYNACVFKGVLDHYPLKSVKDVKGFFDKLRYPVAGGSLTLNEMEAKGRALGDWRIHFGVVCASSSCPFLRNEAYDPDRVDAQLTEQLKRFLADPSRGLRIEPETLWLSKIFKWYAKDFVSDGQLTVATLMPVIGAYLIPESAQLPRQRHLRTVKFLDYDWTLNKNAH